MKALIYIKIQLKNLFSNFQVSILYFIGLPLIIGLAMNFMNTTMHENTFKIEKTKVKIEDKDNSKYSTALQSYLKDEKLKEVIEVVDEDFDLILEIPKGYGDDVLGFKNGSITIKDNNSKDINIQTLKGLLDSYHINLFKSLKNGEGASGVEQVKLENKQVQNPVSFYAVSLIGMVMGMIILGLTQMSVDKKLQSTQDRIQSTPISITAYLNLKYATFFIYTFLSIAIYCMVYRISGKAFTGNLGSLFIVMTSGSLIVTSIIVLLSNVFGEKYARIVSMLIFALPIIGGGMFMPEKNPISGFSPITYISSMFEGFERTRDLSGVWMEIAGVVITALLLYLITLVKLNYRRNKNENSMANMG